MSTKTNNGFVLKCLRSLVLRINYCFLQYKRKKVNQAISNFDYCQKILITIDNTVFKSVCEEANGFKPFCVFPKPVFTESKDAFEIEVIREDSIMKSYQALKTNEFFKKEWLPIAREILLGKLEADGMPKYDYVHIIYVFKKCAKFYLQKESEVARVRYRQSTVQFPLLKQLEQIEEEYKRKSKQDFRPFKATTKILFKLNTGCPLLQGKKEESERRPRR